VNFDSGGASEQFSSPGKRHGAMQITTASWIIKKKRFIIFRLLIALVASGRQGVVDQSNGR
jgi:hypothetical protein